uniref:Uncharacterized protein n=1 Tax=Zooxanthella nutricula TaxID=1333877 RepID=A0A6U6RY50_9DINO
MHSAGMLPHQDPRRCCDAAPAFSRVPGLGQQPVPLGLHDLLVKPLRALSAIGRLEDDNVPQVVKLAVDDMPLRLLSWSVARPLEVARAPVGGRRQARCHCCCGWPSPCCGAQRMVRNMGRCAPVP